jgi:hypothetical protein
LSYRQGKGYPEADIEKVVDIPQAQHYYRGKMSGKIDFSLEIIAFSSPIRECSQAISLPRTLRPAGNLSGA